MLFNSVIGTVQLFHLLDSSHIPEKLLDFFQMIFVRKIVELPSRFSQKWNMKAITGKVLSDKDFAITLQKDPHKLSSRIWELPHANSRSPTTLLSCLKTSCSNLVQGKDQRWASQLHLGAYQALYKHQRRLVLLPALKEHFPSCAQPPDKAAGCVTSECTRWGITESVAGRRGRRGHDEEHR